MNVAEAVASRQSVRAFAETPVPQKIVRSLLEHARLAPSGGNLQPWKVYALGGERLAELKSLVAEKIPDNPMGEGSEYQIYPSKLKEPYRSRRFACGESLYDAIGVARDDKAGRLRQFAENFRFFGAPVGLFFAIDRCMQEGQWSDLGMFIQTLMLLAREQGLDTCAQESWAYWHETISKFLGMPDDLMLFCGMALGYKDEGAAINKWRTGRAALDEFVEWHWENESDAVR